MGTKCSLSETSHAVTFYRKSLSSHAKTRCCTVYPIQRGALSPPCRGNDFAREKKHNKKKRSNADRLSRASRAVDLHVAGSDKSATAETAATSREIDGERERPGWRKRESGCRVAVARDLSRLSRFFIRRLCLAGFASQVIRDCLRVAVSLSLPALHGESFPGDISEMGRRVLPGTRRDSMSRISDNLHPWCYYTQQYI